MAEKPPPKTTLISDSEGYTRLHITPLDSDLLKIVVPAAVLPQARNISYHTLETFPDKRYGFVELPTEDADKLRKKLNGATLRGTKVRIEQARPELIPQPTGDMENDAVKTKKVKKDKSKEKKDKKDKARKRKWEGEVVEGVAIEDRNIKRGWTVTESDKIKEKRKEKGQRTKDKDSKKEKKLKKREVKSKYTDAPECLFKQKLPAVPNEKKEDDDEGADKEEEPRRKKRKGDRQVVVHEFERTTKYPTFLKSTVEATATKPLTFEDGKGWVDDEGNVVETAKNKRPTFSLQAKPSKKKAAAPVPAEDDETSSSGSSSGSDSDEEEEVLVKPKSANDEPKKSAPVPEDDETSSSGSSSDEEPTAKTSPAPNAAASKPVISKARAAPVDDGDDDDTSSSGSSSDEDEDEESGDEKEKDNVATELPPAQLKLDTEALTSPVSALKNDSSRPKSSGSTTSLTIKIPPITPAPTKVHPLEALYKRPAGTEAPADAGFSFFGNEDDIQEDGTGKHAPSGSQNPMTPFSKQDFDFRNIRSAAPTPDTAHPSRFYNSFPGLGDEDTVEEEDEEEDATGEGEDTAMANATDPKADNKGESRSEFQDWFWEHRGDLNRSWKKRRKTASKEKRNRENRARAAKAI